MEHVIALVIAWCIGGAARSAPPPDPVVPGASAGALAGVPARGLAATIAEAGKIEVPAVDPRQPLALRATQATRWTEGSYDVWHLTGGVTITQGATDARAHEAVVWIDRDVDDVSTPRSVLVRMAGDVRVRTNDASAAVVRGPSWAGRFWTLAEPTLDFASVTGGPSAPPVYDGPVAAVTPAPASSPCSSASLDRPRCRRWPPRRRRPDGSAPSRGRARPWRSAGFPVRQEPSGSR
jgi:hypothetical protein